MKFIFKVIVSILLLAITTVISVSLFLHTDSNADSYISIGKFPININAQVFEYSNIRKSMYAKYDAWKYEMSKNISKSIYNVGNFTTKLHLKHDLKTIDSSKKLDYVAVFSVKDVNSKETIDLSGSHINITSENVVYKHELDAFSQYMKILKYDRSRKDFFVPKSIKDGASVVMIDLKEYMGWIPNAENANITLVTKQGRYSVNIKDRTVRKDTIIGNIYVYNYGQRNTYRTSGSWLRAISRDIIIKYYLREREHNLTIDVLDNNIRARSPMTYIGFVHGLNFDKPNMFDKRDLILEIKTNDDHRYLDYKTLRHHTLFYNYDEDSDDFVNAGSENIVDACSIDLATLIAQYKGKQYIKIKISTTYDDIIFDLK